VRQGQVRGRKDVNLTESHEYLASVRHVEDAVADACKLTAAALKDVLYPNSGGVVEGEPLRRRRAPLGSIALNLQRQLETLFHLLQTLSAVLTYGRTCIAKRMEKAHGVGQDVEAMRVCNLLLAGAQVPADSEDATKFRATFPRPMSQALSMEEYEAQVEQAFEDIASSTRLARRPEDNAANVPRRGLFSALAGIFSSNGSLHEPDGDAGADEDDPSGVIDDAGGVSGRWALRSLLEFVMRLRYPSLTFTLGPSLWTYAHLRGAPHKVLQVLHAVTGAGTTTKRCKGYRSNMVAWSSLFVLTFLLDSPFVLGADNFVRTCVIRTGIGRHGSYMLGDYTSLIFTLLVKTVWSSSLVQLAMQLQKKLRGCRHCCKNWADESDHAPCLACSSVASGIDYNEGATMIKAAMKAHTLKFPTESVSHFAGWRRLDLDAPLLSPNALHVDAVDAACALAKSSFALFDIEIAYAEKFAASRHNSVHDPDEVERAGTINTDANFAAMDHTHVLGLLAVCSNTTAGLLTMLLMLRLHPVLGPILDSKSVPLLCDVKLYKTLIRLFFNTEIDQTLLRLFWPVGLVILLGVGLHLYKKLIEKICLVFSGILKPLFEDLAKSGGKDNAGNWFNKAKMSKFVTFLGALLLALSHNSADFDSLCADFPLDPFVIALRMLLRVYVPLAFLTMAVVRMSASPRQEDRQRAFTVLHEEILPQMVVHFRTLGSPEYSKVCLEYYTRLNYWKEHRPDLYAMFAENGARVLNEVHAHMHACMRAHMRSRTHPHTHARTHCMAELVFRHVCTRSLQTLWSSNILLLKTCLKTAKLTLNMAGEYRIDPRMGGVSLCHGPNGIL